MSDLAERYKTCGRCVHDGEGDSNISGSTCYLCKRNPDDHRIDWFEERKEEWNEKSWTMKEFFEEHSYLKLALQQVSLYGGCWRIQIYNTTYDYSCRQAIFEHYVTNETIENLNVDFETAIMASIIEWWDKKED